MVQNWVSFNLRLICIINDLLLGMMKIVLIYKIQLVESERALIVIS